MSTSPLLLFVYGSLKRVGQPGGYLRIPIRIEPADAASALDSLEAFAYVQHESRLAVPGAHLGPLSEYTQEHARALRW
jgi:hypothetical protein